MSPRAQKAPPSEDILEGADASLLEIIDHVLNKGVMVHGELFLGVAGVDLIYLRVSAMLCAADKILPAGQLTLPAASKAAPAAEEGPLSPARRMRGGLRGGVAKALGRKSGRSK